MINSKLTHRALTEPLLGARHQQQPINQNPRKPR